MMDKQLKEATLAVLHNNEIIMQQTEDINTERGDDNRVLGNMRKIYDGVREKINNDGAGLTSADCKFLIMAIDIAQASLQKQLRAVTSSIELHDIVRDIYTSASEEDADLQAVLGLSNPFDLDEEDTENDNPNT